jgi:hypothetical protein
MGSIYIRYPDGQMTQRTEEEARRLWSGGLMPDGTIYWQEGMQDWQPVAGWLGEHPVALSDAASDPSRAEIRTYQFQVEPKGLTRLLQ